MCLLSAIGSGPVAQAVPIADNVDQLQNQILELSQIEVETAADAETTTESLNQGLLMGQDDE